MFSTYIARSELGDAILANVAALIADIDTGEIIWASEPLEIMFGYPVFGELSIGRNIDELVPERFLEVHQLGRKKYAERPCPRSMSVVGKRTNGVEFPIEILLRPRVIGGIRCVVAIVTDMSQRMTRRELPSIRDFLPESEKS